MKNIPLPDFLENLDTAIHQKQAICTSVPYISVLMMLLLVTVILYKLLIIKETER